MVISHNYRQHPGFANLIDDLREPGAACVRVFDAPHLLAGINHESVRDAHSHLIFDEGAIGQVLNPVIWIYLSARRGLL
jgi:hypothetical protein